MVDRRELSLGILFTGRLDETLRATLGTLRTQMANMAGATTKTGAAAAGAAPKVKKIRDEFSQVGKQLSRVEGGMQRVLAAFKVVAAYGIAGTLTFGIIRSIRGGVSAIFDFNQALYNLQAITDASEGELQSMGKAIFQVAETTKFSAKEVGDAMVLLGQAGFSAAESVDAIEAVAKLATGTLTSLETSADLLTTVIRAFRLEAWESSRVADVMANAVNRSKLTVDKLRIAFNYLGPVANLAGIEIEEAAAAAGLLANAGIRASTIGTGLRQVIARLTAPNERLREAFIRAGADMTKFTSGALNMRDVIAELQKIVPDTTRAFQLFGLRGAPAVAALTSAGVEGFDAMYGSMIRAGEATRMAETQMEGLVVMLKNLLDRLGTLAIRIGEGGIAGAFEVFIRVAREAVKWMTVLAENVVVQMVIGAATLSTVILALAASFRFLSFATSSLVAGLAAVIIGSGHTVASMKTMIAMTNTATVAWAAFVAAVKAHPFFFIASAIGLVVAGLRIWHRHQKQQLLNLQAEEEAANKNVEVLTKYKEKLDELIPGTKEYGAILRRLGEDFKDLKKYVDESTNSWIDHGEALDKLIEKNAEAAFRLLAEQIKEYNKQLDLLERRRRHEPIEFMPELAGTTEGVIDVMGRIKEVTAEIESRIGRLAGVFHKLGYTADSSVKDIREELERMFEGVAEDDLNEMVTRVILGLLKIKYETEKVVPDMKALLAEIPDFWKKEFDKLDAEGQSYFVQSLARMNKEISAFEDTAKELGLTEKQRAANITAIRLRLLEDFIDKNYEEVLSAREKRGKLEELEKGFTEYRKNLLEKELSDIEVFQDAALREAKNTSDTEAEFEKKKAEITDKYEKQRIKAKEEYAGAVEAIDNAAIRRRIEDEKEAADERYKIAERYARLMESLETDPYAKLKLQHDKRIALIQKQYQIELEAAKTNQKLISEAEDRRRSAELAAEKAYIFEKSKLDQEKTEETIRLEAAQLESRLERLRTAAVDEYDTRKELREKELGLEAELLQKYLALADKRLEAAVKMYGEDTEQAIKAAREREEVIADIEKNYGDRRRLQHEIHLNALRRDTQEYLDYRIRQMRASGATEDDIERERWEHVAEYSESWLERMRAGLGIVTLDFKESSRDWASLVINAVDNIENSLGDFFYSVMKGSEDASDAFKNLVDSMLRTIAEFMAKRAVMDFLMLLGQIGAAYTGAGTTGPTAPQTTSPGPGGTIVAHRGGEVGVDIFPKRFMQDWLFRLAPRLHQGLRADEFPAILQRGEEVTSRDDRGGEVRTVNIFTPDTRTMSEWVRRNRAIFAGATVDSIKEGNRALIGAVRSVKRG